MRILTESLDIAISCFSNHSFKKPFIESHTLWIISEICLPIQNLEEGIPRVHERGSLIFSKIKKVFQLCLYPSGSDRSTTQITFAKYCQRKRAGCHTIKAIIPTLFDMKALDSVPWNSIPRGTEILQLYQERESERAEVGSRGWGRRDPWQTGTRLQRVKRVQSAQKCLFQS